MAFFNKLKSVFGFSNEDYEAEINEMPQRDATVTPLAQRRKPDIKDKGLQYAPMETDNTLKTDSNEPSAPEAVQSTDFTSCPEAIFTKVVEIFNESLPPFLRESIDPEKQARYIHEALDDSMKDYVERLANEADARMKAKWETGQSTLRREMESLREKAKQIEGTSAEIKEQKLSAERQKRALSERVHDLEKQIDAFQAEKEQYELENKSLVNKLRAMSIQDEDVEALRNDNEALRKEIKELKENTTTTVVPAVDQEKLKEIEKLKSQNEDLVAQKEGLIRERTNLANDIIVLKKKCEITDVMINDLNHKASSAKLALAEKETQYKELQEKYDAVMATSSDLTSLQEQLNKAGEDKKVLENELSVARESIESAHAELQRVNSELHNESAKVQQLTDDLRAAKEALNNAESSTDNTAGEMAAKDAKIEELQSRLDNAENELKAANEEVAESRASLTQFEQVLVKIEEINETRQNRITELQLSLKEKEEALDDVNNRLSEILATAGKKDDEIAQLKATIENNLQLQAASESLLREELERLRKPSEGQKRGRKKVQQISSIDDSLDDTNWLVSTPPEGTNARPTGVSDAEFGYQAPQHREEPNNPAQMSLW